MDGWTKFDWHEDREVNPGVPDISFICVGGDYETGWMELKACHPKPGKYMVFHIEPSQHTWMQNRAWFVPCFFLCACGDWLYLVNGVNHARLSEPISHLELYKLSIDAFQKKDARQFLHSNLTTATNRKRDGQERV